MSSETQIELSSPEDHRAIQSFILYLRHTPITVIERAQNISRRTVYRDIDRAKEIFGLDMLKLAPELFFETAEALREAWSNYQNAEAQLRIIQDPQARIGFEIQKSQYLAMINNMLRTRIEAAKLLLPKETSTTITTVPTQYGAAVQIKREVKTAKEILEEMKAKGELHVIQTS